MAKEGIALKHSGDYAGAEAKFRSALAADPNNSLAHYGLGWLLIEQGKAAGDKAKIDEGIKELQAFKAAAQADQALLQKRLRDTDGALRRLGVKVSSTSGKRRVYRQARRSGPTCPCGADWSGLEGKQVVTYTLAVPGGAPGAGR